MNKHVTKGERARNAVERRAGETRRIEELLRRAGHGSAPLPPPNRSCDGKTRYGKKTAIRVAAERSAESGEPLHAYYCIYCDAHHIGHP